MQTRAAQLLLRKLSRFGNLDQADVQAIRALPFVVETKARGSLVVREGKPVTHCRLLIAGYACSQKITSDGKRQITALHLPGDFVNLSQSVLGISDYDVFCLSTVILGSVNTSLVLATCDDRPKIAHAFWLDTLIEASRLREWLVNVGRRSARTRIAHFLCEFAERSQSLDAEPAKDLILPMTQADIADATGLTAVHVNRTIKVMHKDGIVEPRWREILINDRARLEQIADLEPRD